MAITGIEKDYDTYTLRVDAEFAAPIEQVWQLWADPRKLERWWGPPEWPATFSEYNFTPGGFVAYHMTGPDGTKAPGWWRIEAIDPPTALTFVDGFADQDGKPVDSLPMSTARVKLTPRSDGSGTTMTLQTTYASREALETVLDMGMEEGLRAAMGQIDPILAEMVAATEN